MRAHFASECGVAQFMTSEQRDDDLGARGSGEAEQGQSGAGSTEMTREVMAEALVAWK